MIKPYSPVCARCGVPDPGDDLCPGCATVQAAQTAAQAGPVPATAAPVVPWWDDHVYDSYLLDEFQLTGCGGYDGHHKVAYMTQASYQHYLDRAAVEWGEPFRDSFYPITWPILAQTQDGDLLILYPVVDNWLHE